jgi:SAM-dependent methyltransferase
VKRRELYYWLFNADRRLAKLPRDARVLDVGCSDGSGSEVLRQRGAWGVDIYRPALERGARANPVQADVRKLPYRDRSFDAVVALDVIEHFDKDDALGLLGELERVSKGAVVVVTPSGFQAQPGTEEEPWQEHKCGFHADELRTAGYEVTGFGGFKWMRAPWGGGFKCGAAGKVGVLATDWWVKTRPDRAYVLLGTKGIA